MRTITLELLRHGPAHNQLLSPLTPYLALCENHGAVTLNVPFEHNQFLHRLDALGYALGPEPRLFQLKDTAAVLGKLLGMVPGLTAEASKQDGGKEPLTHLRLIISASELALLPFELALSPEGFPGSGQHLLLQSQMPICLTREIRRAPDEPYKGQGRKRPPRILFAAASPRGVGAIPLDAHLLALRRVIEPWMKYYAPKDDEARRKRVEEHLVFLPEASIEAIEKECASGEITHVHILAHGVKTQEGHDSRFVLALHDAGNPAETDRISGTRLATALRAADWSGGGLARPDVVTLASCDSGNVGSVAGAGASIAHALHEAGIPMVVAGQFPLSFAGSVRMLEILYDGLLWGADPRSLLFDLRRRLYSQFPDTHDWASLTAYVSLPPNFEDELSQRQISQAQRSFNAAMNHADATRRSFEAIGKRQVEIAQKENEQKDGTPSEEDKSSLEKQKKELEEAKRSVEEENREREESMEQRKNKLQGLLHRLPQRQALIHGLLAAMEKRQAEVLYAGDLADTENSIKLLKSARDHYWDAFLLDRTFTWAIVQYLSLDLIIGLSTRRRDAAAGPAAEVPQQGPSYPMEMNPERLWRLAFLLSRYDLNSQFRDARMWAHQNMIELHLLTTLMPAREAWAKKADERAIEYTDNFIEIAGPHTIETYSTRRQMFRYVDWYPSLLPPPTPERLKKLAADICARFPAAVEEKGS